MKINAKDRIILLCECIHLPLFYFVFNTKFHIGEKKAELLFLYLTYFLQCDGLY